jgi:hypothetical protein
VSRDGHRSGAELLLLIKVAAASTVGGLMAMLVLWYDDRLALLAVVLVVALAAVLFCVMVVNTFRPEPLARARPVREQPGCAPAAYPPQLMTGPQHPPSPIAAPPPPFEPVHNWFDDAARDAAANQRAASPVVGQVAQVSPEPEGNGVVPRVEEYPVRGSTAAVRRVVQCPRCAGFDLDVREETGAFTFGCQSCRHIWRWTPGTPWPPTIARPALGSHPRTGSV